ncbi:hypothetical protein CCACVL1_14820 [Corchorus capsularis]|uniref:BSD domain-containing protein n=1 Tax=Corchorus capsularis TaxID=210143 RepID=A0A1R3I5A9_COCAP|nr:hypothetical protein CCACVL1_14820 [Corchorus capsularis]
MDFFKSVFADDDPPKTQSDSDSDSPKAKDSIPDSSPKNPYPDPNPNASAWSFGGLIKTIATRSESVIETYRRDLQEFGSGLKKEIEVAQGSLGNVGHVIDEFGNTVLKGTAQIINQGKEAILAAENESDSPSSESSSKKLSTQRSLNSKSYSRFDAQVRVIQRDVNTYSEEPEDLEDYKKWKSGFSLEEKKEEIERLMEEIGEMRSIYNRVVGVSNGIDHETFWCSGGNVVTEKVNLDKDEDSVSKSVQKAASEGKSDNGESSNGNGKDSDFSVVSSHQSMPDEEDLGWDEIEDLSSIDDNKNVDDKKGTHGGSPSSSNRADLRKRLSTAEEDEDLSWDIEDDDEPVKA